VLLKVGISREDLAAIAGIFGRALLEVQLLLTQQTKIFPGVETSYDRERQPVTGRSAAFDPIPEEQRQTLLALIETRGYGGGKDPLLIRCLRCQDCRNDPGINCGRYTPCAACGRSLIPDANGIRAAQPLPTKINPPNIPDWPALAYFVERPPEPKEEAVWTPWSNFDDLK
jgi:hypothetical protein